MLLSLVQVLRAIQRRRALTAELKELKSQLSFITHGEMDHDLRAALTFDYLRRIRQIESELEVS